jgi:hypothetical protein
VVALRDAEAAGVAVAAALRRELKQQTELALTLTLR